MRQVAATACRSWVLRTTACTPGGQHRRGSVQRGRGDLGIGTERPGRRCLLARRPAVAAPRRSRPGSCAGELPGRARLRGCVPYLLRVMLAQQRSNATHEGWRAGNATSQSRATASSTGGRELPPAAAPAASRRALGASLGADNYQGSNWMLRHERGGSPCAWGFLPLSRGETLVLAPACGHLVFVAVIDEVGVASRRRHSDNPGQR